jgi:hypothetical protein
MTLYGWHIAAPPTFVGWQKLLSHTQGKGRVIVERNGSRMVVIDNDRHIGNVVAMP